SMHSALPRSNAWPEPNGERGASSRSRTSATMPSQTVTFDFDPSLPVARQVEQVLAAIASGQIAPDLGQQIVSAIGTLSNIRATEELSERLAILEAKAVN
ncbi:hypothetical protein, partial [Gemmobacter serpentinus]|uniref:hypothetical protein n=1 Tax=Gemmobacter serpentinus TaxID=2652247 RepID=UPI001CF66CD7